MPFSNRLPIYRRPQLTRPHPVHRRNHASMSDELDRNFVKKMMLKPRAAVEYLLRGAPAAARGDIVREIIEIVREVAKRRAAKSSGRWHARWLSAHPPLVGQICFVSCLCSEET